MRKIVFTVAAAGLAATIGAGPAAADEILKSWATAGWDGGAHQDPNTGEIYCLLWHEYGDGMQIQLGLDSLGYYVVLSDPAKFAFLDADPFDTPLQVDSFYPTKFEAYANSTDTLVIDLASDTEFVQLLASGAHLSVPDFGGSFGLAGSADAVAALNACYDEQN